MKKIIRSLGPFGAAAMFEKIKKIVDTLWGKQIPTNCTFLQLLEHCVSGTHLCWVKEDSVFTVLKEVVAEMNTIRNNNGSIVLVHMLRVEVEKNDWKKSRL